MKLVSPRLIIVGAPLTLARRQGSIWLHSAQISNDDRPVASWIDEARSAEWHRVRETNGATIQSLRDRDVASPSSDKTWVEFVDHTLDSSLGEFLGMDRQPALLGESERKAIAALEPVLKLARDIVSRPTVIGLVRTAVRADDSAHVAPPGARIARELSRAHHLLETNSVAFIRLNSSSTQEGADDPSDRAFDELMRDIMSQVTSVASIDYVPKEGPLLLVGATGSGKTELARALHQQLRADTRRQGGFHSVNIAAVEPRLLEARLRGFFKGSFTDALHDQPGWFEIANGGTLFLDEIQAAPMDFQVQLLDLLSPVSDTVEVARMGAKDETKKRCRVRVVMATNESEESLLASGRLRLDLAFRIRSKTRLMALSERLAADGSLLVRLLRLHRWRSAPALQVHNGRIVNCDAEMAARLISSLLPDIDGDAIDLLKSHPWPGNLRELERVCFDAFLEYDRTCSPDWVGTFKAAIGTIEEAPSPDIVQGVAAQARIAREIERLLVSNEFNVSAVQAQLAVYKKKSPLALKSFLRANVAHLNLERWTSRRARRLLGRTDDGAR
ncbi:MAG TPA: sigma 54-interacting transcriptional regulator [Steroidobacteraceae bacterium]|jgi:DNA-binding NtrC family response regulator|nr:sigma 54-interacting transcriptional regulator [Steroidobacteraceae bacterium]